MGRGDPIARKSDGRRSQPRARNRTKLTEARFVFLCLEWEMNTKCPAIISDVPDANELAIDDEGMELPTLGCPAGGRKIIGEYG